MIINQNHHTHTDNPQKQQIITKTIPRQTKMVIHLLNNPRQKKGGDRGRRRGRGRKEIYYWMEKGGGGRGRGRGRGREGERGRERERERERGRGRGRGGGRGGGGRGREEGFGGLFGECFCSIEKRGGRIDFFFSLCLLFFFEGIRGNIHICRYYLQK